MAIRRLFSTFFILLMAVALSACSGKTPESTIEAFYSAAEKGDVDKATDLISFSNVNAAQMTSAKGKVQMMVGEMQQRIAANDGLKNVEILDTQTDPSGKSASVRAKVVFKNGKDQVQTHRLVNEDGNWKLFLK